MLAPYVRPGGSSPHTRGAPRPSSPKSSFRTDHPRIRGEHRAAPTCSGGRFGSSPHTRGAPPSRLRRRLRARIIPAYAGSTTVQSISLTSRRDHPRIRGEHGGVSQAVVSTAGSSPHTRGAPAPGFSIRPGAGIIPAYAGSTATLPGPTPSRGDHPRIRGEHVASGSRSHPRAGSSPHTRGAHVVDGAHGLL